MTSGSSRKGPHQVDDESLSSFVPRVLAGGKKDFAKWNAFTKRRARPCSSGHRREVAPSAKVGTDLNASASHPLCRAWPKATPGPGDFGPRKVERREAVRSPARFCVSWDHCPAITNADFGKRVDGRCRCDLRCQHGAMPATTRGTGLLRPAWKASPSPTASRAGAHTHGGGTSPSFHRGPSLLLRRELRKKRKCGIRRPWPGQRLASFHTPGVYLFNAHRNQRL